MIGNDFILPNTLYDPTKSFNIEENPQESIPENITLLNKSREESKTSRISQGYAKLNQIAQNTARFIHHFATAHFNREKLGEIKESFKSSLDQIKEKLTYLKDRVSSGCEKLNENAQKTAKSLFAKLIQNFKQIVGKKDKILFRISLGYEKLKASAQETTKSIFLMSKLFFFQLQQTVKPFLDQLKI